MPSAYSTRLRLELMADGENLDAWGPKANAVFQRLDETHGTTSFTLSGSKTLTANNGSTDESRAAILNITSGSGGTVNIPSVENYYFVMNRTSGDVTIKPSGTGFVVPAGMDVLVKCDGTDASFVRLGGWGEIPAVAASVFTLDLSTYREFIVLVNGYQHNSGGNANLTFAMKESGGTFTNYNTLIGTLANTATVTGHLRLSFMPGQSRGTAVGQFANFTAGGNAVVAATATQWITHRYQSAQDIIIAWSAGTNVAGSLKMFARP